MRIFRYIDGKKHKKRGKWLCKLLRNSFIAQKNVAKAPQLETNSNYNIELDRSIQSESPRLIRIHCRIGHGNDHM